MTTFDTSSRFIFDNADVRGSFVRLQKTYLDITGSHDYPDNIRALLGEFLVASFLLRDTIKFEGRLTMQVTGSGPIKTLMVESTHDGKARGIVQLDDTKDSSGNFNELFADGLLAVTVEPDGKERYQSLVPLEGNTLSACLEHYFAQSDQLGTVIKLFANNQEAGGMLLQQLPPQLEPDSKIREAHWQTTSTLGTTLNSDELMNLENDAILHRLFSQENESISLISEAPLHFSCSCSEQRFASSLLGLGAEELEEIFIDETVIAVSCEFCKTEYQFDQRSLIRWATGDDTIH